MSTVLERRVLDVFESCEKCGYEKGFHLSFIKRRADEAAITGKTRLRVVLVCPNCAQRYDLGLYMETL